MARAELVVKIGTIIQKHSVQAKDFQNIAKTSLPLKATRQDYDRKH
jgi:hypothetical protein